MSKDFSKSVFSILGSPKPIMEPVPLTCWRLHVEGRTAHSLIDTNQYDFTCDWIQWGCSALGSLQNMVPHLFKTTWFQSKHLMTTVQGVFTSTSWLATWSRRFQYKMYYILVHEKKLRELPIKKMVWVKLPLTFPLLFAILSVSLSLV